MMGDMNGRIGKFESSQVIEGFQEDVNDNGRLVIKLI